MQHKVLHTVENMYHRSRNCNPQRVVHCIVAPTRFCAWVRKHSTESVARTYNEASFGGCCRKKGSPFSQSVIVAERCILLDKHVYGKELSRRSDFEREGGHN